MKTLFSYTPIGLIRTPYKTLKSIPKSMGRPPVAEFEAFIFPVVFPVVLEGEQYKRIIDKEKPQRIQQWYQKKNLYLSCNRAIDKILFSSLLMDDLISGFKTLEPFYKYLWEVKSITE